MARTKAGKCAFVVQSNVHGLCTEGLTKGEKVVGRVAGLGCVGEIASNANALQS
jgi:hypothetical protein